MQLNIKCCSHHITSHHITSHHSHDLIHDAHIWYRFIGPTTFPGVHTLEEYAEKHGHMMKEVTDLHFVAFDVLFAHHDRVCIRYTAEGSHNGMFQLSFLFFFFFFLFSFLLTLSPSPHLTHLGHQGQPMGASLHRTRRRRGRRAGSSRSPRAGRWRSS